MHIKASFAPSACFCLLKFSAFSQFFRLCLLSWMHRCCNPIALSSSRVSGSFVACLRSSHSNISSIAWILCPRAIRYANRWQFRLVAFRRGKGIRLLIFIWLKLQFCFHPIMTRNFCENRCFGHFSAVCRASGSVLVIPINQPLKDSQIETRSLTRNCDRTLSSRSPFSSESAIPSG